MKVDVHVHVAQPQPPGARPARAGWFLRALVRRAGLSAADLAQPDFAGRMGGQLAAWADASSVDRFVLLALDAAHDAAGRPDPRPAPWAADNRFVAGLAQAHPKLLWGASVHPYRPDALAALERAIDDGACLVKWIPSAQRIRLDDPRCVPFYEALAAHGLPLLVHTGPEHICGLGRSGWNDAALLVHALRRAVTVIAAHCGARMFLHERCGFPRFARLALEHERLYGDLSAFGLPTRMSHLRQLGRTPALWAKVVYGSDFPAVVLARSLTPWLGLTAVRALLREGNPLERPYRLLRMLGLPDEVFTRAGALLRRTEPVGSVR